MFLAAEFGVGQVLWSLLYFTLVFMWIWLVIMIFSDIIRSDDLSGWSKALWSLLIIFLPYLGVFVYIIARGDKMSERQVRQAQAQEQAFASYVKETAGGASPADQLATLADLHASGKLDDAEYASAKAKIIST